MGWKDVVATILALLILGGMILVAVNKPQQEVEKYWTLTSNQEDLPITNWEDAFELAIEKFGSEEIWRCDREDMIKMPKVIPEGDLPADEFGMYGYRGTTLIDGKGEIVGYTIFFECNIIKEWDDQGRPKSGVQGLRFNFDPNNGWIEMFVCNNIEFADCPKYENGTYVEPIRRGINPSREEYLELI